MFNINHVAISVTNVEKSIEFYKNLDLKSLNLGKQKMKV